MRAAWNAKHRLTKTIAHSANLQLFNIDTYRLSKLLALSRLENVLKIAMTIMLLQTAEADTSHAKNATPRAENVRSQVNPSNAQHAISPAWLIVTFRLSRQQVEWTQEAAISFAKQTRRPRLRLVDPLFAELAVVNARSAWAQTIIRSVLNAFNPILFCAT